MVITLLQPPSDPEQALASKSSKSLAKILENLRQSTDLAELLQVATAELRLLLKADRVAVYQFQADWSGHFIAESVESGWPPVVGQLGTITDSYLQENQGGRYAMGHTSAVADIHGADLTDCHIELLEQFQAKAFAIAPIFKGDRLWGLMAACQNEAPRNWQASDLDQLVYVGAHIGFTLRQDDYLAQVREQAVQISHAEADAHRFARQKLVADTIDKIRRSLDLQAIFDITTREVRQLLTADRVTIYRFNPDWSGEFVAESAGSKWESLMEQQLSNAALKENVSQCSLKHLGENDLATDTYLQETQGGKFSRGEVFRVCNDIYAANFSDCYLQALESYQARAYVIIAIYQDERLWGLLATFSNDAPRDWQADEIDLLTQISTQLSIGLQQAEYLAQVKAQTVQLTKASRRQQALAATVDKIRRSLDIDEIFQATTQEVRQLLDVDRVAIYRFNADWSGQFVTDSLSEEKDRLDPQPPQRIAVTQANSEGQYPRHETFVPISHGEQLWGLLIAYQSHEPRYWQTDEISLLTQVGAQLGVALNQAELLTQTRQQSVKLEQALAKLQQTQTQLIQNEKMAGLGQLVAGIAHEINNPVNFIFGNIPHANEQVQGLLSLIRQYQTHYPNPPADIGQQIDLLELDFVETDLPKVIDSMAVGAQRIQEIVKGLRVFSRTDEVDIKRVDLHEGLNSTLMILGHRLKAHEGRAAIQVELDYGNLPLVECYPGPLNQVFMNLLNNALDALDALGALSEETHPAPTVTIRTMARPDSIQVEIEDNGAGMSEAVRSQIFNPFFTTKPIGQGTGLGLSISHSIVTERHGGQIRCISAPGQGTTFTLQLPRQATNRSVSHLT